MLSGPVRVSYLDAFREWRDDDDSTVDEFLDRILGGEESEAMMRGTAFHSVMEGVAEGRDTFQVAHGGFEFHFTGEFELALPKTRELRRGKDYGGIVVTGKCDAINALHLHDHKTCASIGQRAFKEGEPIFSLIEQYQRKYQWRYYLDINEASIFTWHLWEMKEVEPRSRVYQVYGLHSLTQYRYPGMHQDCMNLAQEFREFAEKHMQGIVLPDPDAPRRPPPPPKPSGVQEQLRESVKIEPIWEMKSTRGRNLVGVGWRDGILRCAFAANGGNRFYCYRDVPEAEFIKLQRSPFPDRLFSTNIKTKYEAA